MLARCLMRFARGFHVLLLAACPLLFGCADGSAGNGRHARAGTREAASGQERLPPLAPAGPQGINDRKGQVRVQPDGEGLAAQCGEGKDQVPESPAVPGIAPEIYNADGTLKRTITLSIADRFSMEMLLIPSGEFTMGSPADEWGRREDEGPQHRVVIPEPFYLGQCEVTQRQWEAVMRTNRSRFRGPDRPIENVSWFECQEFVARLNEWFGWRPLRFRLPSEAEWEYACRAGTTTAWSFGSSRDELPRYAWFLANSDMHTHPVAQEKANPWGMYDMHGNVDEWCSDRYGPGISFADYTMMPIEPSWEVPAQCAIIRGGSYLSSAAETRCALRGWVTSSWGHSFVGFRLAASIIGLKEKETAKPGKHAE